MQNYNSHGRQVYLEMLHTITPSANFIVDKSFSEKLVCISSDYLKILYTKQRIRKSSNLK
ncbi:hypothetical protein HMPREF9982_11852 [Staphylococcus epidermidis NIHLM021]|nr:hypothetical protein HMPREF9982_11852 [Staphylococcus epidermidis NIHLM021]